jgi:hypothetical protein
MRACWAIRSPPGVTSPCGRAWATHPPKLPKSRTWSESLELLEPPVATTTTATTAPTARAALSSEP